MTIPVPLLIASESRLVDEPETDRSLVDPLNEWRFLRAAEHHGPGRGRARVIQLVTSSGESTKWGFVERSRFGLRAAVAFTTPSVCANSPRVEAWGNSLRELASRRIDLVRLNNHATVRLSAADHSCVREVARDNKWTVMSERFGTYVIDLDIPADERLKRMHRSHRQSISSASRAGLELDVLDPADVAEYLRVSDETYSRQGRTGISHDYLRGLAAIRDDFRFYVCRDPSGVTQAVSVVLLAGDRGVGLHGGSGKRPTRGAGQWFDHAIANALAGEGFAAYDLGGVDLFSRSPKAVGIREFKARFGGRLEIYDSLEVVFRPRRAALIRMGLAGMRLLSRGQRK